MTETQRDECLIQLVKSVNKLENRMDNFENKLNENIAFTQRISESVAVMEVEHGSKLNALFDGYNVECTDNLREESFFEMTSKHS